jgi:gliding motility-associated-like protein
MAKKFRSVLVALVMVLVVSTSTYACSVTPNFTYVVSNTCGLPNVLSIKNTSTGTFNTSAKYWWKVNGKTIDTTLGLDSIVVLLKKTGTNTIKLFVRDSSGCVDSTSASSVTVTTNAKTIIDQSTFGSHSPQWVNCLMFQNDPDTFRIKFSSADTLKQLRIIWGDGNVDTSFSNLAPNTIKQHLYRSLGSFEVKIVTTNGNCIDTVYGTIVNQRIPTAGIIGPPSGNNRGCVPHQLRIVNNSYNISNLTQFLLEWGDGESQNLPYTASNDTIYHTYTKGMCAGVIKLTASNVCGSSFTTWNPVDISDKDKALWAVDVTCDPTKSHVFRNLSNDKYCLMPDLKEYFWNFGDGNTIGWTTSKASQNHKYAKEGDYTITLISKNACGVDTFKDKIKVFYNPKALFSFNQDRGCNPLSVTLKDTSKGRGITREWKVTEGTSTYTFKDSILNYTFTKVGTHSISLRVSNKCGQSTLSKNFRVNGKPKAQFATIASGCTPLKVSFTNTTNSYFVNPTYSWNFGDNTTSTQKNPVSKVYTTPGNYEVVLVVNDSCGTDTFKRTFTVYGLPVASFTADTSYCTFDSISFVNQSINSTLFKWNMGDNQTFQTSNLNTLKYAYKTTGTFTVRLISGTGNGCADTAFQSVKIKPGAKAVFNINKLYACAPASFKITNSSLYSSSNTWYLNNSLLSQTASINDILLSNDTSIARLKLIVTSASSCQSDTLEKVFFTPANPVAAINNLDSGCGVLSVNFVNGTTFANQYKWTLGNGQTSTLKNPSVNYVASLTNDTLYNIQLSVKNWLGCADTTSTKVKVFAAPKAIFTADKTVGCGPLNVSFTNNSITNNANPNSSLSYLWQINQTQSTQKDLQHVFVASNKVDSIYSVVLKVTSQNGCVNSANRTITVRPNPNVNFSLNKDRACYELKTSTLNLSKPGNNGNITSMTFNWNFGNGSSANSMNSNVNFKSSVRRDTSYKITLIGKNQYNCVDTAIGYAFVYAKPVATFAVNANSGCTPFNVKTNNQSFGKDTSVISHYWDFNSLHYSAQKNDSFAFVNNTNANKLFNISYIATTQNNCKDTVSTVITVRPKPFADFKLSSDKICAATQVTVTDQSQNAATYFWGTSNSLNTGNAVEGIKLAGIYLFDTTYTIYHQVTSPFGCLSDVVSKNVIVMGKPKADFVFSKDSLCSSDKVKMTNNSYGASSFMWRFGKTQTSLAVNPTFSATLNPFTRRDSIINVGLFVTSAIGCKDTLNKNVYLVNKPVEKINIENAFGCTDLNVNFENGSSKFKVLSWDMGDNNVFFNTEKVTHSFHNASQELIYQPKIQMIRQYLNCKDTAYGNVIVYPKPKADFISNRPDICDDGLFKFVNQSKNFKANTWLINENQYYNQYDLNTQLTYSAKNDTLYRVKLIVKNAYSCVDSTEKDIKLSPKMVVKFKKTPIVSCEKGNITFTNQSENAVRYFWKFGDGGISNEIHPNYIYNRYGNYKVKLYGYNQDGCVDSSDNDEFVKVLEIPIADFVYGPTSPKLPNAKVDFISKPIVYGVDMDALKYEWNFGDQSAVSPNNRLKNPVHFYKLAGNLLVTLKVSNEHCTHSVTKPIYIEDPKPIIVFESSTIEGCAPLSVSFKNQTTNAHTYRWIFGDGTNDSYEKEPTHVFEYGGEYNVTLIATGSGGETKITNFKMINVFEKPIASFFSITTELSLPNGVFKMINTTDKVVENRWKLYDSAQNVIQESRLRDASFFVNQVGKFSVELIATNSMGCKDSIFKEKYLSTILPGYVYTPSAFSPNNNSVNELFKPSLFNVKERNYSFRVYNRWGELIFETTDINGEWDGTFNGVDCAQENYLWTISGEFLNNETFSQRGTLTLLR